MDRKKVNWILIGILLVGAAARLGGIWYRHFPDEAWQLYRSLKIGAGEFYPNWFVGVYSYLMFVWYSLFFVLGLAGGYWSSLGDFMGTYYTDPHVFYVAGRIAESMAGVAGIFCLYRLGKRWFSRRVGLTASFFLALNITHVQISQLARGQAIALLLGLISLLFLERFVRLQRWRDVSCFAMFLAGAVSIRIYYLGYCIPAVWAAVILARSRRWKALFGGALSAVVVFLFFSGLFTPELFLKPVELSSGMSQASVPFASKSAASATGVWQGVAGPLQKYLLELLPDSLGWPLYLTCWGGIILALTRSAAFGFFVVGLLPILTFFIMGQSRLVAARYLIPVFPMMFLAAALFLEWFYARHKALSRKAWCILIPLFLVAPDVDDIVRWDIWRNRAQTLDLAKDWILDNVPDRAGIAVESTGYAGPNIRLYSVIDYDIYRMSPEELEELYRNRMETDPESSRALKYFMDHPPKPWHRIYDLKVKEPVSVEYLLGEGVEYFVLSSGVTAEDFRRSKYPDLVVSRPAFYDWVEKNCELLRTFSPSPEFPGPEIRVFRFSSAGE